MLLRLVRWIALCLIPRGTVLQDQLGSTKLTKFSACARIIWARSDCVDRKLSKSQILLLAKDGYRAVLSETNVSTKYNPNHGVDFLYKSGSKGPFPDQTERNSLLFDFLAPGRGRSFLGLCPKSRSCGTTTLPCQISPASTISFASSSAPGIFV